MKLEMRFQDYLVRMQPYANRPLLLNSILEPFGLSHWSNSSDDLLVGHLLDLLNERFTMEQTIDPVDLTDCMVELGHKEAEAFAENIPVMLWQAAKASIGMAPKQSNS